MKPGLCVCGHHREDHNQTGCTAVEIIDELHISHHAIDHLAVDVAPCDCERFRFREVL